MSPRPDTPTPTPRAPLLWIVALAGAAPLLMGAVHLPTLAALTLLTALLCAAALVTRRGTTLRVGPLSAALALLALAAAAQLLPLPEPLLELLNPHHAQARHALRHALPDLEPGGPLTLAPAETALALGRYSLYALAALGMAAAFGAPRVRSEALTRAAAITLVAAGALAAALGALHLLIQPGGSVLGLIPTQLHALPRLGGPFVNANHAGAFQAMTTLAAAALASSTTGRQRWAWAAAAAALAAVVLLIASRSATLALGAGLTGLALHSAIDSLRRTPPQDRAQAWLRVLAALASPLLGAAALAALASLAPGIGWEYFKTPNPLASPLDPKLQVIQAAAQLLPESWLGGLGADAFGRAAPPFLPGLPAHRYAFVECDPLELLLDFGLPLGGAALLLLAVALGGAARPRPIRRDPGHQHLRRGLLYALVALFVSSLGSFNLPVAGLTLPALVLLTVLLRSGPGAPARTLSLPPVAALAALLTLLATLGFALTPGLRDDQAALELLRQRSPDAPPSLAEVEDATRRTLGRTPADPLEIGRAALLSQRAGARYQNADARRRGLALAELAAQRAPHSPTAQIVLARALLDQRRPDDAAARYQHALSSLFSDPTNLLREIEAQLPDPTQRARAIPPQTHLVRAAVMDPYQRNRRRDALELAVALQALHPHLPEAHYLASLIALRSDQPLLAELYAETMERDFPDDPRAPLLRAQALRAQGRDEPALDLLHLALTRHPEHVALLEERARLCLNPPALSPNCAQTLPRDLTALQRLTLRSPAARLTTLQLSALRYERLGQPEAAQRERLRAAQLKNAEKRPEP